MLDNEVLLKIDNLSLGFDIEDKFYTAVKNVSLDIEAGKMHAIVGESGSGKTMTVMSIIKLLPKNARVTSGKILFEGKDILKYKESDMKNIRGKKIALIPQDPMTSLNPLYTIENQLLETIMLHNNADKKRAKEIALEALKNVEIKDAENKLKAYPHELSGGMKQRVIIAMALATNAEIILADEPTTALDVTIQAQILSLLENIKKLGKSIILITHDLGIVRQYSDFVSIMYLGKIVERADVGTLFNSPKHPYTRALIAALPVKKGKKLENIKGQPSPITKPVSGCPFHPRCKFMTEECVCNKFELTVQDDLSEVACRLYQ